MGLITRTSYVSGAKVTASGQNANELLMFNLLNGNIENVNIKSNAAIAATKLNLASVAQVLAMSASILKTAKGADVASATTTTLGDDGNFFDITGTTTITSVTAKTAGTVVILQFDGILTFTDGSNLKLNGNMTTAAESTITLVSDGTNWYEVARTGASAIAGAFTQLKNSQSGAFASGTTAIPFDDTIPQITEGDQYFSLAITPRNANNLLKIDVVMNVSIAATAEHITVALFQDATSNALASQSQYSPLSGLMHQVVFSYYMVAGTASATTFRVRAGCESGGVGLNGLGGARKLGGVMMSGITISEVVG